MYKAEDDGDGSFSFRAIKNSTFEKIKISFRTGYDLWILLKRVSYWVRLTAFSKNV